MQVQVGRCEDTPARIARVQGRHAQVTLDAPKTRKTLGAVTVWAVWTREINAPAGVEPLDWMLLTTVPTDTFEAACERLAW